MDAINTILERLEFADAPPKRIIVGMDIAKEIKQSKFMLKYGKARLDGGWEIFGVEVQEDSSIPKDKIIFK